MRGRSSFKFDSTYVLFLIGLLFLSSLLYLFLSQRGRSGRLEYFSTPVKYSVEYFYINGCPHCENFDPVWKKVSEDPSLHSAVEFKKLEISANSDRAKKFNINSAPTIVAVDKKNDMKIASAPSEARSEEGFRAFVKNYV